MTKTNRVLDARARRVAARVGLIATKSRQRTYVPNLDNLGEFALIDREQKFIVAGARFELTAEAVIEFCEAFSAK